MASNICITFSAAKGEVAGMGAETKHLLLRGSPGPLEAALPEMILFAAEI